MRGIVLLFLMAAFSLYSRNTGEAVHPLVGRWKFISQSSTNDFQIVLNSIPEKKIAQYFVFEKNHSFRHEITDSAGHLIKTFKGKWKPIGNRVNISYKKVNCNHTVDYFFVGNDLIFGRNFNTIIFIRDEIILKDIAMK